MGRNDPFDAPLLTLVSQRRTATESCAADNETGTTDVVSGTPELGSVDGYWYLVRGVNCKGKGTYDSGGAGQAGSRDAEIAGSSADCP